MARTSMQEVEVQDLVYNTKYQFRIRPALVTAANGETVEEGKEGPASVYYKTACIGNVHTSMRLRATAEVWFTIIASVCCAKLLTHCVMYALIVFTVPDPPTILSIDAGSDDYRDPPRATLKVTWKVSQSLAPLILIVTLHIRITHVQKVWFSCKHKTA